MGLAVSAFLASNPQSETPPIPFEELIETPSGPNSLHGVCSLNGLVRPGLREHWQLLKALSLTLHLCFWH